MLSKTPTAASRRGAVTVWLVVCLGVIITIVALGLDGGRMMEERRRTQAAADDAALAAATDLYFNYATNQGADPNGSAQAAALASAQANGYANDGTSSVVTVNIPPRSGTFAGQADHVEVIVQSNLPGSFSALFTSGPLRVQARAVARGRPQKIGLLLLQNSGSAVLSLSGNASVNVNGAPIVADTPDAQAYAISGNATVSASYHDVAGTLAVAGNILGPIHSDVPPTPDPLRSLAPPGTSSLSVQTWSGGGRDGGDGGSGGAGGGVNIGGNQVVVLQPGIYNGGISVGGSASVTLMPGIYVLNGGGLQVTGNGSVTGTGVLLYNTGTSDGSGQTAGSLSITGNGSVNLTPPTSGPYQGIAFFQDRTLTNPVQITGNGNVQITGVVYAPAASIQLSGNGDLSNILSGGYIATSLQASGNAQLTISPGVNRPRIPEIELVE